MNWIFWLKWASLLGSFVQLGWVFLFTRNEAYMGFVQKIMYLHLPTVWGTYLAFFLVFLSSIAYLWKREESWDRLASASAEVGVLFCFLLLFSGALWGKPTWGAYWVWDARLTTTLLLFLIYLGYLLLRRYAPLGEKRAKLSAVLGIIGFLNLPLIHYSVEFWRTLHQPSSLFKRTSQALPPEFFWPLMFSMVVASFWLGWLLLSRLEWEKLKQEAFFGLRTED